jgi:hypothetical protein
MEIINNISKTLKDDLAVELKKEARVSIAASCFSMYAPTANSKDSSRQSPICASCSLPHRSLPKNRNLNKKNSISPALVRHFRHRPRGRQGVALPEQHRRTAGLVIPQRENR